MAKNSLGVNPWFAIWAKPRETIQRIVDYNPKFRFVFLSFLYGLPMLLHTAQNISAAQTFSTVGIVIAAIVLATFVGMLGIVIASALILWTGKWIGGTANFHKVRAAVAWSNVPNVISIIVWAVLIFFFRERVFIDGFEHVSYMGIEQGIVIGAFVVQAIAAVWSFIILVKSLGQVQGFSAWKGVLNVLIPFFLVGIFIWIVSWFFWMGNGAMGA